MYKPIKADMLAEGLVMDPVVETHLEIANVVTKVAEMDGNSGFMIAQIYDRTYTLVLLKRRPV